MPLLTRGQFAVQWVGRWTTVRLTAAQERLLRGFYDGRVQQAEPWRGSLGAAVALLHVAGPPAVDSDWRVPMVATEIFSVWRAAGDPLRQHLRRRGEHVHCIELGTTWPPSSPPDVPAAASAAACKNRVFQKPGLAPALLTAVTGISETDGAQALDSPPACAPQR